MSEFTYNTDPDQLTSFLSTSPGEEEKQPWFKSFFNMIKNPEEGQTPLEIPGAENNLYVRKDETEDNSIVYGQSSTISLVSLINDEVKTFETLVNKVKVKKIEGGELLEGAVDSSQSSPETSGNFKKYWMPDDQCKECYECGAVFSTFRRRHHCRLCGQIFCYECCSDVISGKFAGFNGEVQLRVCKYCLGSVDVNSIPQIEEKRRTSKYMLFSPKLEREKEIPDVSPSDSVQEELKEEDVWQINLHFVWCFFRSPDSELKQQPLWHRLRYYSSVYYHDEVLDWLKKHLGDAGEPVKMLEDWKQSLRLEPIDKDGTIYKVGGKDDYNENTIQLYEQMKKDTESGSNHWVHRVLNEAKSAKQSFDVASSTYIHIDAMKDLDDEFWAKDGVDKTLSLARAQSMVEDEDVEGSEVIDTLNKTVQQLKSVWTLQSENAEYFGYEILNNCIKHYLNPSPSILTLPKSEEVVDPDKVELVRRKSCVNLKAMYDNHMEALLEMLIEREDIPGEWISILKKLVSAAANEVMPNTDSGDNMDIRRYVKFKKFYGEPEDSTLIDGYVFSKTVAHKKMKLEITNPTILLLSGSISYQRVLNKLTSLNPVFLQEKEFLKNVIDRVASFNPDILIVEKSVSQIAKDELLDKGITLILNLKPYQLEKIGRLVKGDIIQNLDNIHFIPSSKNLLSLSSKNSTLGSCKKFKSAFVKGFHGSKSMIYLKGCNPTLGKTILLKGSDPGVLKRVKKVATCLLYALFNSRLELNYYKASSLSWTNNPVSGFLYRHRVGSPVQSEHDTFMESGSFSGTGTSVDTNISSSTIAMSPAGGDPLSLISPSESFDSVSSFQSVREIECNEDEGELREKLFGTMLGTQILSITPFVHLQLPYLETLPGSNCKTRGYFEETVYWSELLESGEGNPVEVENKIKERKQSQEEEAEEEKRKARKSSGEFVKTSFTPDDIAYFRAFGRWPNEGHDKKLALNDTEEGEIFFSETPNHIKHRFERNKKGKDLDCLEFANHQKILVLFTSFSAQSFNHPQPCIVPWIVNMQFYGKNDVTLGMFLRDYCFQETYQCPNFAACKASIVHHERRFTHNGACINLRMAKFQQALPEIEDIPVTWSVCQKCLRVSDIKPVSRDTWNYSFAKFLELKFYETEMCVAGACNHSFQRDNIQYFALGGLVASFSYTPAAVKELTPLVSKLNFSEDYLNIASENSIILNDLNTKTTAVFKDIKNHMVAVGSIDDNITLGMPERAGEDENRIRATLALIIEDMEMDHLNLAVHIRRTLYRAQSSLVQCVEYWNNALSEAHKQGKADKRRFKSSSNQIAKYHSKESILTEDSQPPPQSDIQGHRRVNSDSCIYLRSHAHEPKKEFLSRTQSLDNLMFVQSTQETKPLKDLDIKHVESKLNRVALKARKYFSTLTDVYQKIEAPYPPEEHHLLTGATDPTVLVSERHFSSIIAYSLSCEQYRAKVQLLQPDIRSEDVSKTSLTKPHSLNKPNMLDSDGHGHWMNKSNVGDQAESLKVAPTHTRNKSSDLGDESVIHKTNHVDMEFQDGSTKFHCKVYFAAEFERLRSVIMPGEASRDFIQSLCVSHKWRAKGGKSGLAFNKTQDDRWVIKEMSRLELQALLMFMPDYLEYIIDGINQNRPSLLAKIVCACTVGYYNSSGASLKQDVIIMENIFKGVSPAAVYDLKGSMRNRLGEEGEEVLLDENYLHLIAQEPIYLWPHCKTFLREAVHCDTAFLASQSVIDYSLLVGICDDNVVVGIIDYIRKFTFDKKVEMIFKSNLLGSAGKMPTIVSPEMYRERFCDAMDRYFPLIPDKWTGMGADLDCSKG